MKPTKVKVFECYHNDCTNFVRTWRPITLTRRTGWTLSLLFNVHNYNRSLGVLCSMLASCSHFGACFCESKVVWLWYAENFLCLLQSNIQHLSDVCISSFCKVVQKHWKTCLLPRKYVPKSSKSNTKHMLKLQVKCWVEVYEMHCVLACQALYKIKVFL